MYILFWVLFRFFQEFYLVDLAFMDFEETKRGDPLYDLFFEPKYLVSVLFNYYFFSFFAFL
jgi:hypothetical protein